MVALIDSEDINVLLVARNVFDDSNPQQTWKGSVFPFPFPRGRIAKPTCGGEGGN
jgi:hypothetical protein